LKATPGVEGYRAAGGIARAGLALFIVCLPSVGAQTEAVSAWITNPDRSALLQHSSLQFAAAREAIPQITIDSQKNFRSINGFGFALTFGSAQLLARMSREKRATILRELFGDDGENVGLSYLRVSIGASDMNEGVYSYDDISEGQTDKELIHFSLAHDEADVIPILKEILSINPGIRILGSPWSAPAWMKTNGKVKGGKLKQEFYPAYSQYFVRYIEGMQAQGITIDAITIQNEPLNSNNTPSMVMEAAEEAALSRTILGPH
jgi:glucosylceramidase